MVTTTAAAAAISNEDSSSSLQKLRWTVSKSWEYYNSFNDNWLNGANYIPSTASNVIEMWHEDTFDIETIKRELFYASSILGYKTMRVFLHNIIYEIEGSTEYLNRIDTYLNISSSYNISTIFVLFDGSWNPNPIYDITQQQKVQSLLQDSYRNNNKNNCLYNWNWVQSPGKYYLSTNDTTIHETYLKPYVQDIVTKFANDKRIVMWDLYNEPGQDNYFSYGSKRWRNNEDIMLNNPDYEEELLPNDKVIKSFNLLKKVMLWVREVPSLMNNNDNDNGEDYYLYAPVTVGTWEQHRHRMIDDMNFNNNNNDNVNNIGDTVGNDDVVEELTEEEGQMFNWIWENVDIISFHNHNSDISKFEAYTKSLKELGRPVVCTEYLGRRSSRSSSSIGDDGTSTSGGNTFDPILSFLQQQNIWSFHGGFVNGKTQLHCPLSSWWEEQDGSHNNNIGNDDVIWYQDILYANGTAYDIKEIMYIQEINELAKLHGGSILKFGKSLTLSQSSLMNYVRITLLIVLAVLYCIGTISWIRRRKQRLCFSCCNSSRNNDIKSSPTIEEDEELDVNYNSDDDEKFHDDDDSDCSDYHRPGWHSHDIQPQNSTNNTNTNTTEEHDNINTTGAKRSCFFLDVNDDDSIDTGLYSIH